MNRQMYEDKPRPVTTANAKGTIAARAQLRYYLLSFSHKYDSLFRIKILFFT